MPKIYSDIEKQNIVKRLKEEANECMKLYGVKKTTVDELVKRVGIPKGTFYLFYKSKELLLFDVLLELHDKVEGGMHAEMTEALQSEKEIFNANFLTNLFYKYIIMVSETCLIKLMMGDELPYLISKLPDDVVREHLSHDDDFMEQIFSEFPNAEKIDKATVSGALRAICMMLAFRREIGEKNFESSIYLLIKGVMEEVFSAC